MTVRLASVPRQLLETHGVVAVDSALKLKRED
jgi:hypothetical protein